tara:strand:- start:7336 stop:8574 length:1239 start_codon:yes stop_codon:yes gene_type:complete
MFPYKNQKYKLDIVFPNKVHGGVYSLGLLIVYNIVSNREDWYCERIFSNQGKITAPLVGFTLQWELDLTKAIAMKPKDGLTFAGGPLANMNPELIAKHFDFLFLGDVEEPLQLVLDEYEKGSEDFLERISKIDGVYIPKLNEAKQHKCKNLSNIPYPLVQPFPEEINDNFVFGKCFILELERSCPYNCKFCPLPSFYNNFQFRSLEQLKEIVDKGLQINHTNKIIIYAPSFIHPQRKELLQYLIDKKVRVSVPSIKAEHCDLELLQLIKKCGQKSITIAPECGQRLRFEVSKRIKDQQYFDFIDRCNEAGLKKLKLYMLIGLPNMTEKDLEEWINFVKELKNKFNGEIYLSINYFVAKPNTPFAEHPFDKKVLKKQAKIIKKEIKGTRIKMPSIATSHLEWRIAHDLMNQES